MIPKECFVPDERTPACDFCGEVSVVGLLPRSLRGARICPDCWERYRQQQKALFGQDLPRVRLPWEAE